MKYNIKTQINPKYFPEIQRSLDERFPGKGAALSKMDLIDDYDLMFCGILMFRDDFFID